VSDLQQNPGFISAIQLGMTLSSLALSAIGEPVISNLLDTPLGWLPDSWHGGVALTISAVLPSRSCRSSTWCWARSCPRATLQHAERVALVVATPSTSLRDLPAVHWALVAASAAVLRWLGLPPGARRSSVHSEEELKMLVTASREQGVLEEEEQTMLHKVFAFADKDAADVMVPRPDVVALPLELPVAELLRLMLQHPYTRYPVYDGELDDVVGVLHVRDLFAALHDRGIDGVDVRAAPLGDHGSGDEAARRAAVRLPGDLRITWRSWWTGTAQLAGLATLEDLLEEIVGEIGDEFDLPDAGIRRLGKGRMRLGGSFPIEEFNERFGTRLPDEDYHSVGGFVFGELGRAPKVGDSVTANGTRFEVSGVDGPRIVEVDVTLAAAGPQPGEQPSAQGGGV
jgi:CBS domain containing-hemolysin-like protein